MQWYEHLGYGSLKLIERTSDLVFKFEVAPFAFWITRRSDPNGVPLFDTRRQSLPRTAVPALVPSDRTTGIQDYGFIFQDQYLQVG